MGWAGPYITKLRNGQTVQFRPKGNSMQGRIENRQLVTVEPAYLNSQVHTGDIVLCKVHGNEYLHLVKAVQKRGLGLVYQIGNNKGRINGWIGPHSIFGKVIKVED